uniref:Uncharacterized protein n=1 Tax=Aegilops tauschii subsp. strangulata TaxID=200361 RepID=A0A453LXY1_AEGTS
MLATGFGALGSKVVEHWYELYKMDKQGANLWYGSSTGGRKRSQVHDISLNHYSMWSR